MPPTKPVNENERHKNKQLAIGITLALVILLGFFAMTTATSGGNGDDRNKTRSDDMTTTVQRKPGDQENFNVLSSQVNGLLKDMDKFRDATERMNDYLDDQTGDDALKNIETLLIGIDQENAAIARRMDTLEDQMKSSGGDPFAAKPTLPRRTGVADGSGAFQARPSNTGDVFQPAGRVTNRVPTEAAENSRTRSQRVIELFAENNEAGVVAEDREAELKGEQTRAKAPDVFDTTHYVPPNAYVNARLVVSVDAPIGETSQSDPKAAQFIITGKAKHVQTGREIVETDLEGCLVNGSAQGELSSERVSIKLHMMTCPMGGDRVSVSQVEGYATHLGKNGIRGTVVTREGDLVTKAIMAGTLEGLGRTAGQVSRGSIGTGAGGIVTETPSAGDIAVGSLGGGLEGGANVWSQYLLERAKAYEPVVSLPTGIEVELVFISGTLVRPADTAG